MKKENNKRNEILTRIKVGGAAALTTAGLATGTYAVNNIINNTGSRAYATETTLLTTDNGEKVEVLPNVPMIVEKNSFNEVHVKTINANGEKVEGDVSKGNTLKVKTVNADVEQLQFVESFQPQDGHHIDCVNVRNTPYLDGTFENLDDTIDLGAILLADPHVILGDKDISYKNPELMNCFQNCIYINSNSEIAEGFVHIYFLKPMETFAKYDIWDKDKIKNIKLCTEDGYDFTLPYSLRGYPIAFENGTEGILTEEKDEKGNNIFYVEARDGSGKIWKLPISEELKGMNATHYTIPLNPEGSKVKSHLMGTKDSLEQNNDRE